MRATSVRRAAALAAVLGLTAGGVATATTTAASAAPNSNPVLNAFGTLDYTDDGGNPVGVNQAQVQLCEDTAFGCHVLASSWTQRDGHFDFFVTAPSSALSVRVRMIAEGPASKVQRPMGPLPAATFCLESKPINVSGSGIVNVDFKRVNPTVGLNCATGGSVNGEDGAWQLYNNMQEAWETLNNATLSTAKPQTIPPIRVLWPDNTFATSFYRPPLLGDYGAMSVTTGDTFDEAVVMHEYGHHLLYNLAESPLPNYNNNTCDNLPGELDPLNLIGSHCAWSEEIGDIAWTEGFPDFISELLTTSLRKNNTMSGRIGSIEKPPKPGPSAVVRSIEGYVASILWDVFDNVGDDQDKNGGVDRLNEGFSTIWKVVADFSPVGHAHVTTIDEFWTGLMTQHPELTDRLSEIYDENFIPKQPAANLAIASVTDPPAKVAANGQLPLGDETANIGGAGTDVGFTVDYFLSTDQKFDPTDVWVASRSASAQVQGTKVAGTAVGHVPTGLPVANYFVIACVDRPAIIWEDLRENDNCGASSTTTQVLSDLVGRSVTDPPGVASAGDSFGVFDSNQNIGLVTADPSTVRFWLFGMGNEPPLPNVLLIGSRATPSLAPGAVSGDESTVTIPRDTRPGYYLFAACSDDLQAVAEAVETNNCVFSTSGVIVLPSDLVVSTLSAPPPQVNIGSSFTMSETVTNIGPGTAAFDTDSHYYLSTDQKFDPKDLPIGLGEPVPVLASGDKYTVASTLDVDKSIPPYQYYVIACADSTSHLDEADETNNCTTFPSTMDVLP
jgi:CARDB